MKLYFAPLEGIGGYIYRNAQAEFFPRADKYFSPFLAPNQSHRFTAREKKDVAPEHNERIRLVPQIMTNNAEDFLWAEGELRAMGYEEINLNLGCPSRTVVTKCRGAGFLAEPERLDTFLGRVFEKTQAKISVKTRIGMTDPEEFGRLLEIYKRYPLHELIVHPRVQADYYQNRPRMEAFARALAETPHPVVYNGDIFSKRQYDRFREQYPGVDTLMAGRGVLSDPCLFGELRGEEWLTKEKLKLFHDRLLADYERELSGEKPVLFKMKELWFYLGHAFTGYEPYMKKIRKAQRLSDYREIVRSLFAEQEMEIDCKTITMVQ